MKKMALVTGANGHLGNNLVRYLLERGECVKAGVRDLSNCKPFTGLDCQRVKADLLDPGSLRRALAGVQVLYQVGAVFRHWAKDPEREIYQANLAATRNVIAAAAQAGVQKVVYVSSSGALDRQAQPQREDTWNPDRSNAYYRSKTDSEKLAFELAAAHGLDLVSVLPAAIIGPVFHQLTPTLEVFKSILTKSLPFDPNFSFLMVDVRDVAAGLYAAAKHGRSSERYLLSTEESVQVRSLMEIARHSYPELNLPLPGKVPRLLLRSLAAVMELGSSLSGKSPLLQRNDVDLYYGRRERADCSKAFRELGFRPRSICQSIEETFAHLKVNFLD